MLELVNAKGLGGVTMKYRFSESNFMKRLFVDMPVSLNDITDNGSIFIHKLSIQIYHLFLTNIVFT